MASSKHGQRSCRQSAETPPKGGPPGTGAAGIEVVGGVVSRMTGWCPEVRAMRLLIALMMLFVCCVAGGCGVPTPNENFQTAYNAAKKSD